MCNVQIINNEKPKNKTGINDIESETDETNFSHEVSSLDSKKCTLSKTRYLPTAQLYGSITRGTPPMDKKNVLLPQKQTN